MAGGAESSFGGARTAAERSSAAVRARHEPTTRDAGETPDAGTVEPGGQGPDRIRRPSSAPLGPSSAETSLLAMGLAETGAALLAEPLVPLEPEPSPFQGAQGAVPAAALAAAAAGTGATAAAVADASAEAADAAQPVPQGAAPAHAAPALRLAERGLHVLVTQRGGTLLLSLSPAELGPLRVEMQLGTAGVGVSFHPASEEARRLLEGNLGMLRNALQRHGLVVERLVVEPSPTAQGLDAPRAGDDARFDAGGRQSQGRQDAEQELERRTQGTAVPADATFDLPLRPAA